MAGVWRRTRVANSLAQPDSLGGESLAARDQATNCK